jgi:hypothetical protein
MRKQLFVAFAVNKDDGHPAANVLLGNAFEQVGFASAGRPFKQDGAVDLAGQVDGCGGLDVGEVPGRLKRAQGVARRCIRSVLPPVVRWGRA